MSIVRNAVANYVWHAMMENVILVQIYSKIKVTHRWLQCSGASILTDGNPRTNLIDSDNLLMWDLEYYAQHQHLRCKICGFKHRLDHTFFDDYEYLRRFAEYWGDMNGLKPLYAFLEKPWHYVSELPGFFEHMHIEFNNEEQY